MPSAQAGELNLYSMNTGSYVYHMTGNHGQYNEHFNNNFFSVERKFSQDSKYSVLVGTMKNSFDDRCLTLGVRRDWLKNDIKKYGLNLSPDYRPWDKPVGGSDNASFALLDIPVIWYHTDGHPDYHMPGDHVEKINWNKIVDITKASFLNMWNLANEKNY